MVLATEHVRIVYQFLHFLVILGLLYLYKLNLKIKDNT